MPDCLTRMRTPYPPALPPYRILLTHCLTRMRTPYPPALPLYPSLLTHPCGGSTYYIITACLHLGRGLRGAEGGWGGQVGSRDGARGEQVRGADWGPSGGGRGLL